MLNESNTTYKQHLHDTDNSFLLQIKRTVHASNKPLDVKTPHFQQKQSLNVTEVVFSNNPVLQMSPQTKRKETPAEHFRHFLDSPRFGFS